MASPTAVLSVVVKADVARAISGLTSLENRLNSASRSADALAEKLARLSAQRATAKVGIDDAGADTAITDIQAKLDRLNGQSVSANINAATTQANAELDRFKSRLDSIGRDTVSVDVEVNTTGAIARLEILRREINSVQGAGGGGIPTPPIGAGASAASSAASSGLSVPGVLPLAIGAGVVAAPTIGASFVQGTLGLGALATAAGGAGAVGGAGIASVAVGGIGDITKAMTALTAQQQQSSAQGIATAQQALQSAAAQKSAAEQVAVAQTALSRTQVAGNQATAASEEALGNAQKQETLAQTALTQARFDAVRQLTDMRRAATESVTAEQQAKLTLQEAQFALAHPPPVPAGTPVSFAQRQLELNVVQARQALNDAQIQSTRSQQDFNKAQTEGVNQMPSVVAAQNNLAAAHQGVSDAARNLSITETHAAQAVADAQRAVSDSIAKQTQVMKANSLQSQALKLSQNQLGIALKELPPAGRRVVHLLNQMTTAWEDLSRPASAEFFGLLKDGIKEVDKLLPLFASSAKSSVGALRTAFDAFLKSLNSPGFKEFIRVMSATFAVGIGPLLKAFENLARILARIAIAAAPALIQMLQDFREMTGDWLQSTSNAKDLQKAVTGVIDQFFNWLGLIGAVGQVLGALFVTNTEGAKQGGDAVSSLTDALKSVADWINANKDVLNEFFGSILKSVGLLAGSFADFLATMAQTQDATTIFSKAILAIVTALNSLKIGNVSALTALLSTAIIAGGITKLKGIAGAFGLLAPETVAVAGAPAVAAAAAPAAVAGTSALTAGEAAAGGATLGTTVAGSGSLLARLSAALGLAGRGASVPIGGGLAAAGVGGEAVPAGLAIGGEAASVGTTATILGAAAPVAAVATPIALGAAALAGKPGSHIGPIPTGPGVAGLVPDAGQFSDQIKTDLKMQRDFGGKSIAQLQSMRDQANAQWRALWETDPAAAQSAGAESMKKTAKDTAGQISAIIKAKHVGTTFADAVAQGGPALKRQLNKIGNLFDQESTAQQNHAIHAAKNQLDALQSMNLISKQQEQQALKQLENQQEASQKRQKQKWNQFGLSINKSVAGWFGNMTQTVDSLLGNKGITGMVNQLLTGVAGSTKQLHWNATTVGTVAGHLAGFLNIGGARGGFLPGYSKKDNIPLMARGGEAILRPEDHVPMVNRAMHQTYGMGLKEMFNKSGAGIQHFAKGGFAYPFSKSMPLGRIDMGVDANTPGAPVGAIGDATVTSQSNFFAPSYGSSNQGMVYKLSSVPKGYSPSSPYVYIYEGLDKVGGASGHLKAGQLLGHIHASYPGIEMGWATSSGQTLAAATTGYTEGQETSAGKSFMRLIMDLAHGKAVGGAAAGGIGSIPKIKIKGPKGPLRDSIQGIADRARKAANAYLAKQAPKGGAPGKMGAPVKHLPKSLEKYNRQYPANGGSTMPMNKIAELAEWAGGGRVPGVTMAQVTIGESTEHPGAVSPDHGYGLWQITDPYGNSAISRAGFKSYSQMLNPISNAQVMAIMYEDNPSAALGQTWHGISGVTSSNAHYTGAMKKLGGFVMPPFGGSFGMGGVVPGPIGQPRTIVAHGGEEVGGGGGTKRYHITITNWKQGTGWMEEIADNSVNGQRRLSNQLSRMGR